jgi:hypothetical protein
MIDDGWSQGYVGSASLALDLPDVGLDLWSFGMPACLSSKGVPSRHVTSRNVVSCLSLLYVCTVAPVACACLVFLSLDSFIQIFCTVSEHTVESVDVCSVFVLLFDFSIDLVGVLFLVFWSFWSC